MMQPSILFHKQDQVFTITINRPDRRNAINTDVIDGIREGYIQAHADPDVRAIVLTGAGDKAFCAGADLQSGRMGFDHTQPRAPYADLLRTAQDATLPVVARVNGACLAGGMGLLAMVDMAVASEDVKFGLPEVKIGLFPMQVMSLLPRIVPRRLVAEWALTGEPFSAQEALTAGLINHVVPAAELDAKTEWLTKRLVDKSPTAIRRGKYVLRALDGMTFDQAICFTEGQLGLTTLTADAAEGVKSFVEKRPPKWTGK